MRNILRFRLLETLSIVVPPGCPDSLDNITATPHQRIVAFLQPEIHFLGNIRLDIAVGIDLG